MFNPSFIQKQVSLEQILRRVVNAGQYEAALLADEDGLLLAATTTAGHADMVAAMTGLLRNTALKVRHKLALAQIDELTLRSTDHSRMVCRFFQINGGPWVSLAVLVAPHQPYRQVTNRAIAEIQRSWDTGN